MKERGILFRDRLVRRILDAVDPKTQTRRIVKPQNVFTQRFDEADGINWRRDLRCPYGEPGDRLWVREAWRSWKRSCADEHTDDDHECYEHCNQVYVAYRATPRVGFRPVPDRQRITYLDESTPLEHNRQLLGPWKPGIHLRRDHARIVLDVMNVRVERLQDITEEDAKAEGVELGVPLDVLVNGEPSKVHYFDARTAFAHLWCGVNGPDAWKANPWVWVIEFKRIEPAWGIVRAA